MGDVGKGCNAWLLVVWGVHDDVDYSVEYVYVQQRQQRWEGREREIGG